jgi:K+-transporting ATPase KdpF subunit
LRLSLFSSRSASFTPDFARKCKERSMENIVVGIISLLLFIYLLAAMIRPEKF